MKTKTHVKVLALARNQHRAAGLTLAAMLLSATGVFAQVTNSIDCNQGGHGNGCPMVGVYPPGSNPLGVTYGEWTAKWWQWLLSIPGPVNPNLDTTGANCAQGQSGPVWFLAGRFSSGPQTVRGVHSTGRQVAPIADCQRLVWRRRGRLQRDRALASGPEPAYLSGDVRARRLQ